MLEHDVSMEVWRLVDPAGQLMLCTGVWVHLGPPAHVSEEHMWSSVVWLFPQTPHIGGASHFSWWWPVFWRLQQWVRRLSGLACSTRYEGLTTVMYLIPSASTLPGNDTMAEPFPGFLIVSGLAGYLSGTLRLNDVKALISSAIWFLSSGVQSVPASMRMP